MKCLKGFCRADMLEFGDEYLRYPDSVHIFNIERQFADVGFPVCIGCVDCNS